MLTLQHLKLTHIKDAWDGKLPLLGAARSGHWPTLRKQHLEKSHACAVCGDTKGKIEVHHKKSFHEHPQLELDPNNLITLCENMSNGVSCHLLIGHLGSFKSINVNVVEDAKAWAEKIAHRP